MLTSQADHDPTFPMFISPNTSERVMDAALWFERQELESMLLPEQGRNLMVI
jgi:hypothetical protein